MTPVLLAHPRARVALNAFDRISRAWELGPEESAALLGVSRRTAYRILREGHREHARPDTLERISHLISIYEDLAALFGDADIARTWVRRPNFDFGEQSPLHRMLHGTIQDLIVVRGYLDRARQGW